MNCGGKNSDFFSSDSLSLLYSIESIMISLVNRGITRTFLDSTVRSFSVVAGSTKSRHRHGEYPPSERKIKRNQRKEERRMLVEHYKLLDEEAIKSNFEKKWCCKFSL